MSAAGIIQISAVMGSCVAGGAYLPIMSDEAMIVEGTGSIFLAGSYLVKAAIRESIDNETLGGATTHCSISGVTDYKAKDDKDALNRIKNIMKSLGSTEKQVSTELKVYSRKKSLRIFSELCLFQERISMIPTIL
jgi:acetyl-CoA carboxylase carboxyltransferase component